MQVSIWDKDRSEQRLENKKKRERRKRREIQRMERITGINKVGEEMRWRKRR